VAGSGRAECRPLLPVDVRDIARFMRLTSFTDYCLRRSVNGAGLRIVSTIALSNTAPAAAIGARPGNPPANGAYSGNR
jgi:hypothetical protein